MTAPISGVTALPFAAAPNATPNTTPSTTPNTATGATSGSSPTGGTTTGTSTKSTTTPGMLDPQAFLQLLVAQLKYQDPTNPVDTSSFMNQTAMLSQVQTMSSMSSTLDSLAGAQQAQAATGLIGKQITYLDAHGLRTSGLVTSANLLASGATLQIGTTSIPLTSVIGVSDA